MKLMVCVKSCQRDKDWGYHDLIRGTWGKEARALGIDVKFFMGKSFNPYQSDEMHLNCPDDYDGLPFKTREICKWVSGKMVDFVFLCDTDSYLIPRLMLQTGFEKYDYAGKIDGDPKVPFKYDAVSRGRVDHIPNCYRWCSGGFGYFLSKRALTEVAYAYPETWAEDLFVGQVLGPMPEMKTLNTPPNIYSWHCPSHGEIYDPEVLKTWMNQMYRDYR